MRKIVCLVMVVAIGVSMLAGCNSNARQIEENNKISDRLQDNLDRIDEIQEQSQKVQDLIDAYKNK